MEKTCIYCGAPLPEGAAFCHCCAKNQLPKKAIRPPIPHVRHLFRATALAVCAGLLLVPTVRRTAAYPEASEPSAPGLRLAAETASSEAASVQAETVPEEVQLSEVIPAELPEPAASFSFPDAVQDKLAALDFDASSDALAAAAEVREMLNTIGTVVRQPDSAPNMRSAYRYLLDGKIAAQETTAANGVRQFTLFRDFEKGIPAYTAYLKADGSREDVYFYPDGTAAARFQQAGDNGRYEQILNYQSGSQSCYRCRDNAQELVILYAPDNAQIITVTANSRGTEYTVSNAGGTVLQHFTYPTGGSDSNDT